MFEHHWSNCRIKLSFKFLPEKGKKTQVVVNVLSIKYLCFQNINSINVYWISININLIFDQKRAGKLYDKWAVRSQV